MQTRALALFVGACLVACLTVGCFDGQVPPGTRLTCSSSGDCPDGSRCPALIGFCVPDDGDAKVPGATTTMSAELLPGAGTLQIRLTPDETLAAPPIVRVGAVERDASPVGDGFVLDVAATELGGGIHAAVAVLVDDSGNVGLVVIGAVEVDDVLPALDTATPVRLTLTAPPGIVVASPRQVVPGTRVRLVFKASESLAAPPVVVARRDGAPVDAAIFPFSFVGQVEGANVFEAVATDGLGPGSHRVFADLVDLAGNAAAIEVPLPDPGLVVGDIVDSPCVAVDGAGVAICTDFDGDGVVGRSAGCPAVAGFDCDDTDPLVTPGAIEIPGDGHDNDCAGDGDLALDEASAVFVDPDAPAGGNGTRAAPFSDLFTATDAAASEQKWLALRGSSFGVEPDGWFTSTSVLGGLDGQWQIDPALRTRIEFVTARDTVFPVDAPQLYIGLELVSANSLIDATVPLTVVRSSLISENSVALGPVLRLIDVDVPSGVVQAGRLEVFTSRIGADVGMDEGLLLRARMEERINVNGGRVVVVSSSILSVGFSRAISVNGELAVFGSTLRALGNRPGDESGALVNLVGGSARIIGSVLQSPTTLVQVADAGEVFVTGSAVQTGCAFRNGASDCVLQPTATACDGAPSCGAWTGIRLIDTVVTDPDDPHRLADPSLAGIGPTLAAQGAPTSAAGDLFGACRSGEAPALGGNEPD